MVMQTSCKKDMEQMDLLQAFEIIVDKAKNSSLGEKFYEEADSYLGFVSDKLDISKRASAIMALFADRCDDSHIQFSDFTLCFWQTCWTQKEVTDKEENSLRHFWKCYKNRFLQYLQIV